MNTPIIEISGVGPQTAEILSQKGYTCAEDLAVASEKDLLNIKGFGAARAGKIIEAAAELVRAISDKSKADKVVDTSIASGKKKKSAKNRALKKEKKNQKKTKKPSLKKKDKKEKGKKKKGSGKKKK